MLRKLYKDLLEQDFWPIKIYPLLNLYEKYQEQGKVDKFFEFLKKISSDYETEQIKELILCEEENIDIDFITQELTKPEVISNVAKTTELSKEQSDLSEIIDCYNEY